MYKLFSYGYDNFAEQKILAPSDNTLFYPETPNCFSMQAAGLKV